MYLDEQLRSLEPAPDTDGFPATVERLRKHLSGAITSAKQAASRAEASLLRTFDAYQRNWPLPSASTTSLTAYPIYLEILTRLQEQGLHTLRAKWTRAVNDWSSNDLLQLKRVHQRSRDEIHLRLQEVNQILATLSFGPDDDRIHIVDRYHETQLLAGFRKQLTDLASDATAERTDDEVEERIRRLKRFMTRLDPEVKGDRTGQPPRRAEAHPHRSTTSRSGRTTTERLHSAWRQVRRGDPGTRRVHRGCRPALPARRFRTTLPSLRPRLPRRSIHQKPIASTPDEHCVPGRDSASS